jgi:hypothetical protein
MQKFFFAWNKWHNGQRTPVQIEIVVSGRLSPEEARRLAEAEIAALKIGFREALARKVRKMERQVRRLPDYRFIGRN